MWLTHRPFFLFSLFIINQLIHYFLIYWGSSISDTAIPLVMSKNCYHLNTNLQNKIIRSKKSGTNNEVYTIPH